MIKKINIFIFFTKYFSLVTIYNNIVFNHDIVELMYLFRVDATDFDICLLKVY